MLIVEGVVGTTDAVSLLITIVIASGVLWVGMGLLAQALDDDADDQLRAGCGSYVMIVLAIALIVLTAVSVLAD